jgi:hypothetical protein
MIKKTAFMALFSKFEILFVSIFSWSAHLKEVQNSFFDSRFSHHGRAHRSAARFVEFVLNFGDQVRGLQIIKK